MHSGIAAFLECPIPVTLHELSQYARQAGILVQLDCMHMPMQAWQYMQKTGQAQVGAYWADCPGAIMLAYGLPITSVMGLPVTTNMHCGCINYCVSHGRHTHASWKVAVHKQLCFD